LGKQLKPTVLKAIIEDTCFVIGFIHFNKMISPHWSHLLVQQLPFSFSNEPVDFFVGLSARRQRAAGRESGS